MPITLTGERRSFPGQARKGYHNPSLFFDFTNGSAPAGLTYWRSTAGTRFNPSGVMESVPADTPRIDFNPTTLACRGLLVEPTRWNLLPNSTNFTSGWYNTGVTVTADAAGAPDWTATADKLDATASDSYMGQVISGVTAGAYYTGSVWMRSPTPCTFNIYLVDGGGGSGNTAAVCNVTQQWQRFTVTRQLSAGTTQLSFQIGGGSTFVPGLSVYGWGAQLEQGACATSTILTTTAAASRALDIVFLANLFSRFVNGEGTLVVEIESMGNPDPSSWPGLSLLQYGGNARVGFFFNGYSNVPAASIRDEVGGNPFVPSTFAPAPASGQVVRLALAFKDNDYAACRDGGSLRTGSSGIAPRTLSHLYLSQYDTPFNGWIRRVALYPYRVPNADLLAITA